MACLHFFRIPHSTKLNNNIFIFEDILNEIEFFSPDNINSDLMSVLTELINRNQEENYNLLCETVDNISRHLFRQLNVIHEVCENQQYWETIYITSLHRIVGTIKDRFDLLAHIVELYSITDVFIPKFNAEDLVTEDSNDFIQKSRNTIHWNIYLFAKLIEFIPNISINYTDEVCQQKEVENKYPFNYKSNIFHSLRNSFFRLFHKLTTHNQLFLYQSYVNFKDRALLSLKFRELYFCFNIIPKKSTYFTVGIDTKRRMLMTKDSEVAGLELVATNLLPMVLPKAFLECHKSLLKVAINQPWPHNPRIIFTSNAYDTDEIFKIWAAEKVKNGAKYVIGQHGYGIGVNKFPISERYYKRIAHNFITFGLFKDKFTIPTYNFLKKSIRGSFSNSYSGSILIVTGLPKIDKFSLLSYSNFSRSNVLKLIKDFENIGIEKVIIKLHPLDTINKWNVLFHKSAIIPIFLIPGLLNYVFRPKISLVVFTYESTLMLRNITDNIPFILVLNTLDHLNQDYKKFYQDLIEVDIIVKDLDELKDVVKLMYDNVYIWWSDVKRQSALDSFRKNICCSNKLAKISLYDALNR
jgi:putative transferase (TIGR04331 family)